MKSADIKSIAKNLIKIEAQAVSLMLERIDENFEKAVNLIIGCSGHLILTGIGKSGLISKKISSTMSSTGTPSIYLHPGDAIHGDLGKMNTKGKDKKKLLPIIGEGGFQYFSKKYFVSNPSFSIVGRKDNMFISGGENIHPEEIENIFYGSGMVDEAIVVPVKNVEFGKKIMNDH